MREERGGKEEEEDGERKLTINFIDQLTLVPEGTSALISFSTRSRPSR